MYSINLNVQKVLRSGMNFFIDFELQTYEFWAYYFKLTWFLRYKLYPILTDLLENCKNLYKPKSWPET